MTSSPIPWRRSIRTKILLPSVVLFGIFAALVIVGSTRLYTEAIESRVSDGLERDGLLVDALFREDERTIALHARFVADMVRLSEQSSGTSAGRSTLIYLLEFLQQTGMDISMYSWREPVKQAHVGLVRKGLLGIRTTTLSADPDERGPVLSIASAAPIERTTGIREVTVSSRRLDADRLGEIRHKVGVDVTLFHGDAMAASSLSDPSCRQALGLLATPELLEEVRLEGSSRLRDLHCAGDPQKVTFRPLRVGFRTAAVYALSVSLGDLLLARRQIQRGIALTAGLVLLTATFVYTVLIRKITRPLRNLARLTHRVAARDFRARADVAARDEVGELGRSYNAMIEGLERSQRQLDELHQRELERAHRLASIGELASSLAHEIRNPLEGIGGAMGLLRDRGKMGSDEKEIFDEVLKQIGRMEKLTRDLLDYSRPRVPNLRSTDVHEVLDQAIFLVETGAESSGIHIEKDYDTGLPPASLDPEQAQQVFLNLLLNSVQAMDGGGTIRVRTAPGGDGEGGGDSLRVEFEDDGPGMSPEILERAVRPFFTTRAKGTGLGLSIAREIMQQHGGSLVIESAPGRGTKASLVFPV